MKRKIAYLISGIIICIFLTETVNAVPVQPSDMDLHVAYCLGAEEVVFTKENERISSTDAIISDYNKRKARETQVRLDRLNEYLDSHLLSVEKAKMDTVSKQGLADAKFAETDEKTFACIKRCRQASLSSLGITNDTIEASRRMCVTNCNQSLPKLWTCQKLTWLPE